MILGCGRSGTSIFGELFQELGPYRYRSEPPFRDVLKARPSSPSAVKVPRESEGFPPDSGLSFPLGALLAAQPSTVLFWIVRHPLDAVSSLRPGIANDWGHHPRPPDWKLWSNRTLVERCAHHWAYINSFGYDRVSDRAELVRFEEMIRDPHRFGCDVFDRIGVPEGQFSGELAAWASRVQNTNNARFVEAQTSRNYSRPDHSVRVGRWKENLTDEEVRSVASIVREANNRFGYDIPTDAWL